MENKVDDFKVRTYWDTFTGSYQMGPQKQRVHALDTMRRFGVQNFLDVGCGTGPMYGIIKDSCSTDNPYIFGYKGTDYSPAMIKVCIENFPESRWEVQDARHLTEADKSWDCVLLMHSLDHLDDYQAAISEAARVAKRYVCIVLWRSFVVSGTRLNNRNMYGKQEGEAPWEDTHLQEYSKEALETEFVKNNLRIVYIAEGEIMNNNANNYNFMYFLEKHD